MRVDRPRRWFRFSLRTMFVLVTVLCVWLGYAMNWIRQRRDFAAAMTARSAEFDVLHTHPRKRAPMGMSLLGEPAVKLVQIVETGADGLPRKDTEQIVQTAQKLFPEAEIEIASWTGPEKVWAGRSPD